MAPHFTVLDRAQGEALVKDTSSIGIVLRFRDLVTEVGGTITEHRKVLRQYGHVWWGWWYRQSEHVPRQALGGLFSGAAERCVPILLFHSGTFEAYATNASRVVVAPSIVGISSPDYGITPQYYPRGRYPAWFRLEGDIVPTSDEPVRIVGRPTLSPDSDGVPEQVAPGVEVSLQELGAERPTLWLFAPRKDTTT
jgi:hypothetical protein